MGQVKIHGQNLDVDLIIFDKDGTLLDFDVLWGGRTKQAILKLTEAGGMPASFPHNVYKNLGYDPITNKTAPHSPLSAGTGREIATVVMLSLYHFGVMWGAAADLVLAHFVPPFFSDSHTCRNSTIGRCPGKKWQRW